MIPVNEEPRIYYEQKKKKKKKMSKKAKIDNDTKVRALNVLAYTLSIARARKFERNCRCYLYTHARSY